MNFRRNIKQEPLTMQLAPMIDVIMFLLAFFLVTWNMSREEVDIEVKVPSAKHGEQPTHAPGAIVVNIRKDGTITLNRKPVSKTELEQTLRDLVEASKDQAVILRGDADCDYKHVLGVLDICRAANLWNIAFAGTEKDAPPAPAPPAPKPK